MAALAGAGVGGAVGGLTGALIGMGIPEYEAKRYEGRVKDGGILLSVHSDTSDQIKVAKDVLKQTGAQDISSIGNLRARRLPHPGWRNYVCASRSSGGNFMLLAGVRRA